MNDYEIVEVLSVALVKFPFRIRFDCCPRFCMLEGELCEIKSGFGIYVEI